MSVPELRITVLSGPSAGDVFTFPAPLGSALTIGRDPSCNLVLQDTTVSRNHARIARTPEGYFLTDLGSTHGTAHMGFSLKPGEEGRRWLQNGDEFKVGNATFRVNFEEEEVLPKKSTTGTAASHRATAASPLEKLGLGRGRKAQMRLGVIALLLVLLLGLLFTGGDEGPQLPPQASGTILALPQERVIGYLPLAPAPNGDTQHLDKAQFELPPSDLLIEFEYLSEIPLEVFIDETLVERLPANPAGWESFTLVYHDAKLGTQRKLIFDNPTFPAKQGQASGWKRWGVRNVRSLPLPSTVRPNADEALGASIALVDRLNKTADSFFLFLRSLQSVAKEYLAEGSLDAVGYRVALDSTLPNFDTVRARLEALRTERQTQISAESRSKHLQEILLLAGQFDAELWRRTNLALSKARTAAEAKDGIAAHDILLALKAHFPEDTDFRFIVADRMFLDNRIVPPKVRADPGRFRRVQ